MKKSIVVGISWALTNSLEEQSSSFSVWVLQLHQGSLANGSQNVVHRSPTTTSGHLQDQTYLRNNAKMFYHIDIFNYDPKAMVDQTAGALAPIKELATSNPCIRHLHILLTRRCQLHLQMPFRKPVKITDFIKSQPLSTSLFLF